MRACTFSASRRLCKEQFSQDDGSRSTQGHSTPLALIAACNESEAHSHCGGDSGQHGDTRGAACRHVALVSNGPIAPSGRQVLLDCAQRIPDTVHVSRLHAVRHRRVTGWRAKQQHRRERSHSKNKKDALATSGSRPERVCRAACLGSLQQRSHARLLPAAHRVGELQWHSSEQQHTARGTA